MSSFLALVVVFNYKKPKLVVPSLEIWRVHIRVCVIQRNTWFKTLVVFCMRYGHTGIHSEIQFQKTMAVVLFIYFVVYEKLAEFLSICISSFQERCRNY